MKTIDEYYKVPPSISDYGYIGDCHSTALVSKYGSIDWCCMPRIDSASCFGRLLGWNTAGYCQLVPTEAFEVSQSYHGETMILKTHFRTAHGEAYVYDFFSMRKQGGYIPYQQILRIVEGIKGTVEFKLDVVPRFDYGAIKPWIRPYKRTAFVALGGSDGMLISGDVPLALSTRHHLTSVFDVVPNQRKHLSLMYRNPEDFDESTVEVPSIEEIDFRLHETQVWWDEWRSQGKYKGLYTKLMHRSALVLKCLSNAPTGAIAAAATTSLPECPGGIRNWDYRFSWIRDSYFSVRSLAILGFVKEADGFRGFIERSSHSSPDGLQTLFGVYGERRLQEYSIDELEGYRGAKPVRVGNVAAEQLQLDMYGELLDLAWDWHKRDTSPNPDYWMFLEKIVNFVQLKWQCPDFGIWEMRVEPRHFTHSKVMCWVAMDRGIRLAEDLGHDVSQYKWDETRDQIRAYVEEKCYDPNRGVFIQAEGFPLMDTALLLLPIFGFLSYTDERIIRTNNAIRQDLEIDGLLLRYPLNTDGLEGEEGAFLACSFWLVICLAHQGELKEAHKVFKRALSTGNELTLFSEQYDVKNKEMLGNFPQALTHLSLIIAGLALHEEDHKTNTAEE